MKILLIDDDKDFLNLCKINLERMDKSLSVKTVNNPIDLTLDIYKRIMDCDVIISDFSMNAIDGVLINKYLKSKGIFTPFILTSSYDYSFINQKYSFMKCDYFVQKKIIMNDYIQDLDKCLKLIQEKSEKTSIEPNAIFSNSFNIIKFKQF